MNRTFVGEGSGRVNLIGEHTDYNGGYVLPTAIPQKTRVTLALRSDRRVKVASRNLPGEVFEFTLGEEKKTGHWVDYVQGVTRFFFAREALGGFELDVESNVPIGSGLSSSAALEVAVVQALRQAFGGESDPVRIATLCRRVENEFVGAQVGIMDPMAALLATYGTALFVDTRTMAFEQIELPLDKLELVVINSGVSHRHSDGGYNTRRKECEQACAALGVAELRDVDDLSRLGRLPDLLRRRARHVVSENDRVLSAVRALRAKDVETLGRLFVASHESMRDDYEVSVPEIDYLVESAIRESSVFGARLTGGGFGGSIVMITAPGAGAEVARRVVASYVERFDLTPSVLLPIGV